MSNIRKPAKYAKGESPWGHIQTEEWLIPGVQTITTAGHGGFKVTERKLEDMPEYLAECAFPEPGYFEEDCNWALVVLAFWSEFAGTDWRKFAVPTALHYYPKQYAKWHESLNLKTMYEVNQEHMKLLQEKGMFKRVKERSENKFLAK